MVTVDQLKIVQYPFTSLVSTVSTSVTVKLDDSNYLTWSFQIKLLFKSHGIIGFADGSRKCPPRFDDDFDAEGVEKDDYLVWKMHDRALMQLMIATLSTTTMSCVIGSQSFHEMWVNLTERFSAVTKATIFQMKTELQNIKKGSESVSVYLQKIKDARDHLPAIGVIFEDDDIIILALKGLPAEFNTFRCVIRGRENRISL
ncbi:hypothetical protein COP1_028120 [Malus domestica]